MEQARNNRGTIATQAHNKGNAIAKQTRNARTRNAIALNPYREMQQTNGRAINQIVRCDVRGLNILHARVANTSFMPQPLQERWLMAPPILCRRQPCNV